jgi:hypothetical protein
MRADRYVPCMNTYECAGMPFSLQATGKQSPRTQSPNPLYSNSNVLGQLLQFGISHTMLTEVKRIHPFAVPVVCQ